MRRKKGKKINDMWKCEDFLITYCGCVRATSSIKSGGYSKSSGL